MKWGALPQRLCPGQSGQVIHVSQETCPPRSCTHGAVSEALCADTRGLMGSWSQQKPEDSYLGSLQHLTGPSQCFAEQQMRETVELVTGKI